MTDTIVCFYLIKELHFHNWPTLTRWHLGYSEYKLMIQQQL